MFREDDQSFNSTADVQAQLDLMRDGDVSSVQSLLNASMVRLRSLAKRVSHNIPGVKRWEQTDDLLQNSMIRLWKALEKHHPATPLDYYRLASAIMRRELIDLSRHYFGAEGIGANHARTGAFADSKAISPIDLLADDTHESEELVEWTEFHEYVESLDEESRMLFDLLWYQGLTLGQAVEITGMSERTIRRRWKAARVSLYQSLLEPEPQREPEP